MLQSVFVKKIRYAILKMLLGAKVPNNDTCGLFRAAHSHNPAQYSYIAELSSCFYAHIRAGHKVIHPLMSKLMWFQTFCPWHLSIKELYYIL